MQKITRVTRERHTQFISELLILEGVRRQFVIFIGCFDSGCHQLMVDCSEGSPSKAANFEKQIQKADVELCEDVGKDLVEYKKIHSLNWFHT